jgi:neurotrimin
VAWIKADAKAILAIHEHVITNNGRLSVTHNDFNTWTLVKICGYLSEGNLTT